MHFWSLRVFRVPHVETVRLCWLFGVKNPCNSVPDKFGKFVVAHLCTCSSRLQAVCPLDSHLEALCGGSGALVALSEEGAVVFG
jgi:hypothetical protein